MVSSMVKTAKIILFPTYDWIWISHIKYANGKSREFFQIGVSGNKKGISVYVLGLKDKKYLAKTYGKKTRQGERDRILHSFKALKDINIDTLEAAIRKGKLTK